MPCVCVCVCVVRASDKRIVCDEEFSDSEDEGEGGARRNAANHKKGAKRPRVEEELEDKKPGQSEVQSGASLEGWAGLGAEGW